ncbi:MAG: Lrp/AsnC ligand binding domain-containing protein [Crenarchaeota archaeon]|nr:Lrp/AsnC ligand binding domain-containing protein [Thermoproteota archaeon]
MKRKIFYLLGILSGVLSAIVIPLDIIGEKTASNIWIYANVSFVVGSLISVLIVFFLLVPIKGKPLGKYVDPNFTRIKFISGKAFKQIVLMAFGNAIASLGYFYVLYAFSDPSAILPFMQAAIAYIILCEIFTEKDSPTISELHAIFSILFGALLASMSPSGSIDVPGLIIVLTLVNGGTTIVALSQRKIRSVVVDARRYDSINIRLWYLLLTTLMFLVVTYIMNPSYVLEMFKIGNEVIIIVVVSMAITFFAKVTYIRAVGMGKASIVQAVSSVSAILGIPITILSNLLSPGYFVEISTNVWILIIKVIGAVLVAMGIILLALSEVRAIVLIRIRAGASPRGILESLSKIRGVIRVSAVTGKYDYVVQVKLRTLGKAYGLIASELDKIKGVEDYIWLSTLYEWEEI